MNGALGMILQESSMAQWYISIILILGRLRQEYYKLETSLGYMMSLRLV